MIKLAICDDNKTFSELLSIQVKKVLNRLAEEFLIDTFSNGSELLESCMQDNYDLLMLDIDMPELTGFDVSEHLKKNNIHTEIIFISGRDNFVFQSIRYRPFRFIRKKQIEDELEDSLIDFLNYYTSKNMLCTFRCEDVNVSVTIRKIAFFESYNHDILLHMDNDIVYKLNRQYNLKALENEFTRYGFIRTHKSFLVNFRYISLIKENDIILKNGSAIMTSKQRISAVKSLYRKFVMEEA